MRLNDMSADDAVAFIKSNERVFIQGGAVTPVKLVNALLARAGTVKNIELVCISTYGDIHWQNEAVLKNFYLNSLFVSANVRDWVNSDRGDYTPVFLSEIPRLFEQKIIPLDTVLIQISPPDEQGFCSLGTSVDVTLSALKNSAQVIALVNPKVPRVQGDGVIHISSLTAVVYGDDDLIEVDYSKKANTVTETIGKHVAELIEDSSTLQMGIGAIPDAVLRCLNNHKKLGIHTEMFSDGVVDLINRGVVTNEEKKVLPGKTVSSFILGTRKVYDFVHNNTDVLCKEVSFVNDPDVIRRNDKVVAINSAIEVDLTGQVCADSIGTLQYSGIGGQMDFMRGAALSAGGKPIIAMPSTTKEGLSRIVAQLQPGAGVVTTRGHVHYVVTEYGAVNLFGKNMEQRAQLLASIAHPNHREDLFKSYYERFGKAWKPLLY